MVRPFGPLSARNCAFAIVLIAIGVTAFAADAPLFPEPLHLTRQIVDPFSKEPVVIDEYCAGNRIVAVRGDRVTITDFAKGELLEIDRAANTFSRTQFEAIAKVNAKQAPKRASAGEWIATPATGRTIASTSADAFVIRGPEGSGVRSIDVAFDMQRRVSRQAFDALTGAAYPGTPRPAHDAILRAAGGGRMQQTAAGASDTRALLLEETTTYDAAGETVTVRNAVVAIDSALAPEYLLAPLPGAREVESPVLIRERLLEELDRLPSVPADRR